MWVRAWNRLLALIDQSGTHSYISGPDFIKMVREVDPEFGDYRQFIFERQSQGKSTSRKEFFYDILNGHLDEAKRLAVLHSIADHVAVEHPAEAGRVLEILGGGTVAPAAIAHVEVLNAERLNGLVQTMDQALA
jgi:hypothetical protein